MKLHLLIVTLLIIIFCNCSLLNRHQTSNESEHDLDPLATATRENSQLDSTTQASVLYGLAYERTESAAFLEASKLWREFLDHYAGVFHYDDATYYYSYCMFQLGEFDDALNTLKNYSPLSVKGKLLLVELLLKKDRYDEALAVTFELLPNRKGQKKAGIIRYDSLAHLKFEEKIEFYTLRGRIFASIGYHQKAQISLSQAEKLIKTRTFNDLPSYTQKKLRANWAWRQMEVLDLTCQYEYPLPERLSENIFLSYAHDYLKCTSNASHLYCKVLEAGDEQIRTLALVTYKSIATQPGKAESKVRIPAREFKNDSQRAFFEKEMTNLIQKTISDSLIHHRDIKECNAYGVF